MITLEELKEKMTQLDEVSLVEVLEITSADIVDRFSDLIETNFEDLAGDFDEKTPWDND